MLQCNKLPFIGSDVVMQQVTFKSNATQHFTLLLSYDML